MGCSELVGLIPLKDTARLPGARVRKESLTYFPFHLVQAAAQTYDAREDRRGAQVYTCLEVIFHCLVIAERQVHEEEA